MSRQAPHDEYAHKILTAIEGGQSVSQRSLARELGVALGLTNLLVRRLVTKGYIKAVGIQRNRIRYLLTPAGVAEKARISREYLANTVRLYTETRDRIRVSLERLSAEWPAGELDKRVVFYGAGEVAEIGYVGLQSTDLRLVAVVDDFVTRPFFGHAVQHPSALVSGAVNGEPFERVVVMSLRNSDVILGRLADAGVPRDRVCTL